MQELRYNELTGDWVIVAPGRAARPNPIRPRAEPMDSPGSRSACPFCPGNEKETTSELWRYPDPGEGDGRSWRVRVVPNKYPALSVGTGVEPPFHSGPFRRAEPAVGRHEVIIETPAHQERFDEMAGADIVAVMLAYRARFAAAASDPRIRHVVVFRNHGLLANASIAHPHSQLIALPFVPLSVEQKMECAAGYAYGHARSLLLDMVETEVKDGRRVIDATESYVTFTPFASGHAYEVWVAPRFAPARFDRVDDEALSMLGAALKRILSAQREALDDPDYHLILHTPPLAEGAEARLPWYVQLIPRLEMPAGFEAGSGVQITITAPEYAAERLRAALTA